MVLLFGAFSLEIFLLFFIGDVPGLLPAIAGVVPSLLIPAAIAISLTVARPLPAMTFGIVCGLLMDHSRGGPYGFSAMILAALCYCVASLTATVFQQNLFTALLLTVPAIGLAVVCHWLFLYAAAGYGGTGYALLCRYLPMAGYTFAAAIPIYFLTRGLVRLCRIR